MQEGFACLCVCIPHGCLVPVEARGACQISWNQVFWIHSLVVSKPLGAPPTEQGTRVHLWYGPHPAVQVSCDPWCCSFVDDWSQHGKQLALDLHWSWRLIQQQSKKSSSTFFFPPDSVTHRVLTEKKDGWCSARLSEKSLKHRTEVTSGWSHPSMLSSYPFLKTK